MKLTSCHCFILTKLKIDFISEKNYRRVVSIFAHMQIFVKLVAEGIQRAEFHPLHRSSSEEQMKSVNVSCHNSFLHLPDLLCQIKRYIYSSAEQNLCPLLAEKSKGQWKKRYEAHTIWVHSFLCTSEQSVKRLSHILLRTCARPMEMQSSHDGV